MLISKLDKSFNRKNFDCGNAALNRYLKQLSSQALKRHEAIIYVAHKADNKAANNKEILGYYTLSTCHIEQIDASTLLKNQSPYSYIPCVLLGRLAVDSSQQGKGVGSNLLLHAMQTVRKLAENIGIAYIVVDAKDDVAKSFYTAYRFTELTNQPLRLCYPVKDIPDIAIVSVT